MSAILVLSSTQDIENLRSSPLRLWSLEGIFELQVLEHSPSTKRRYESSLNELAGICGCAESSAAGAIALLAAVGLWITLDISLTARSMMATAAAVVAAALLTKFMRVGLARYQLRRLLGALLLESLMQTTSQRG